MAFKKKQKKNNNRDYDSIKKEVRIDNSELTEEQKMFMKGYEKKDSAKSAKKRRFLNKLDMYDMIIANLIAGKAIIEPTFPLNRSQIAIGFSNISSNDELTKYFMIRRFPDWLKPQLIDHIRKRCKNDGVKINFYIYGTPHTINWDAPEMRNRMRVWKQYSIEHSGPIDIFNYKEQHGEAQARSRMINSTKYLNEADLDYKRSFIKAVFVITISAKRDEKSLTNMAESIKTLKTECNLSDIKISELRINMISWLRALCPFSLSADKEIAEKISSKVLTDDILANFFSYKQGRVGTNGICLGMDVLNQTPVMHKVKENPDAAENWLVSAETGAGKSYLMKTLSSFLLAEGLVGCIMDYEGDEYNNFAYYVGNGRPKDVKIVSMGKGSNVYFDPCEIPSLTGDLEVDGEMKENAVAFILAMFRVIITNNDRYLTQEEEKVMSTAISRMYDSVGVTDDKETWERSKGLSLHDVYDEVKELVESKYFVDSATDNLKHKAAVKIMDSASIYFEPGESKSHVFSKPMSANELYDAKLIIFSFGVKGGDTSSVDPVVLALKQLCVSYVNIQISNHCKYVRHCFNFKIWEEFQRYGEIKGSAEIINNVITGGRKRGDVNFIVTNKLSAILDDTNTLCKGIRQNIQNYAIGKIKDAKVRRDFVNIFGFQDIAGALDKIATANSIKKSSSGSVSHSSGVYENAFCIALSDGKKAVVKVKLPRALTDSKLFRTGVDVNKAER